MAEKVQVQQPPPPGEDDVQVPDICQQYALFWQRFLDRITVLVKARWAAYALLLCVYVVRIVITKGFHIVTYGLGIYMLNLLIGFLSPAIDPATDPDGPGLPTIEGEEFRPFTRKLPEFHFWFSAFRALLAGTCMTFFKVFDLPVFWPILLAYFIVLTVLTLKDRVNHMIKYNYVPASFGKKKYGAKPDKDAVADEAGWDSE
eukprot:gnl/TRDRNA2_/TRDRNA2_38661_c0_seq1.p1 gnl/TRDRNA2_/TRDRNA2_38661_c0~~gnl/TRDRNA2_/TRDRNA2_38661_c0_seq1.p1  ORF type:complete len:202 (+),score=36.17 gnl/TRDRNA2_/TRDRNA2_38661_c0_seq1:154-759(+)